MSPLGEEMDDKAALTPESPLGGMLAAGETPNKFSHPPGAKPPALMELTSGVVRVAEWAIVSLGGFVLTVFVAADLDLSPIDQYTRVTLLGGVFFALIAELLGCYDFESRFSLRQAWARLLSAWTATVVAMLTLAFFLKTSEDFSRAWALVWVGASTVGLLAVRGGAVLWFRAMKRRGSFNQRVAIFGSGAHIDKLANYIISNPKLTIDLIGGFDDRGTGRVGAAGQLATPHLGGLNELINHIRAGYIDQVIIALPSIAEDRVRHIVGRLSMLPVLIRLAPDLSSFAFAGRSIVILGDLPLMTLFERPISGMDQVLKRAEDLVVGACALLLLLPVMAIVAIAIKLDSPGPVFFRQKREGFNHKNFVIWKFRTMRTDALQFDAIDQATRFDPRVTRVGRILRATSLDELPQILNVLRGEMSLVGPRPHAPSTKVGLRFFSEAMENYAARHRVKPGMTGWAQVNGWRGETDTDFKLEKRVKHDLFYIEHWSLRFDFYILLRTLSLLIVPQSSAY